MSTHIAFVHLTQAKVRLCISEGMICIILDNYLPLYSESDVLTDGSLLRLKVAIPEESFMEYEDNGMKRRIHVGPRDGTLFKNQYAVVRVTDEESFPDATHPMSTMEPQ